MQNLRCHQRTLADWHIANSISNDFVQRVDIINIELASFQQDSERSLVRSQSSLHERMIDIKCRFQISSLYGIQHDDVADWLVELNADINKSANVLWRRRTCRGRMAGPEAVEKIPAFLYGCSKGCIVWMSCAIVVLLAIVGLLARGFLVKLDGIVDIFVFTGVLPSKVKGAIPFILKCVKIV